MTRRRNNRAPSGSAANPYPRTVAESLDGSMRFRRATTAAVTTLAASKPWRGSIAERVDKLVACSRALASAYGVRAPRLVVVNGAVDCYRAGAIYLKQRDEIGPSVITFLHEFAHHLGKDERDACRWSLNLFRKHFPQSFARLSADRHTLRRS